MTVRTGPADASEDPCRVRSVLRRRGAALDAAIRDAACTELAEVGYAAFSMESVAARARTGKGSLYRRFPDKQQLALYAMHCGFPQPPPGDITIFFGPDASTRDAVLEVLRRIAEAMDGEGGAIMRATSAEAARDPEFGALIDERIVAPRRERMLQLLQRGVQRGEVRESALTTQIAEVGPVMLFHTVLTEGRAPTDAELISLVDGVIMPMLRP
ncbi:MAG: TetR family transcriptional regulator [Jatrophihabitantaceae bacterium]|nr:TetR family transcriptional regulator [Jatrophihabitantaceae bacterium]